MNHLWPRENMNGWRQEAVYCLNVKDFQVSEEVPQ